MTRFTYGATCSWRGPIQSVGKLPLSGLPCCPYCSGVLFEYNSEEEWNSDVESFEADGHAGYSAFQRWLEGRQQPHGCLPQRNVDEKNLIIDLYVREGFCEPVGIRQ
jgi:hypothetical protein